MENIQNTDNGGQKDITVRKTKRMKDKKTNSQKKLKSVTNSKVVNQPAMHYRPSSSLSNKEAIKKISIYPLKSAEIDLINPIYKLKDPISACFK